MGQGERRNKTKISNSRRGGRGQNDASTTNKSTYKSFSKVRESKIPGGSSVRAFGAISLKPTRNEIEKKN